MSNVHPGLPLQPPTRHPYFLPVGFLARSSLSCNAATSSSLRQRGRPGLLCAGSRTGAEGRAGAPSTPTSRRTLRSRSGCSLSSTTSLHQGPSSPGPPTPTSWCHPQGALVPPLAQAPGPHLAAAALGEEQGLGAPRPGSADSGRGPWATSLQAAWMTAGKPIPGHIHCLSLSTCPVWQPRGLWPTLTTAHAAVKPPKGLCQSPLAHTETGISGSNAS
ncbi:uncharacterized protein LOC123646248 [Lemur catta]|uniref:uncharacterized protein LOC123646248 n=1 Tax=Lemur catta TaxID=9447 RepID=UPI001E26BA94|nr:uncharacterized protein LOC123646248 [Lemur catta]